MSAKLKRICMLHPCLDPPLPWLLLLTKNKLLAQNSGDSEAIKILSLAFSALPTCWEHHNQQAEHQSRSSVEALLELPAPFGKFLPWAVSQSCIFVVLYCRLVSSSCIHYLATKIESLKVIAISLIFVSPTVPGIGLKLFWCYIFET